VPNRDGEASRQHLIRCSERYLRAHTADGFCGGEAAAAELAGMAADLASAKAGAPGDESAHMHIHAVRAPAGESDVPGLLRKPLPLWEVHPVLSYMPVPRS
jgi:hypothetical protein